MGVRSGNRPALAVYFCQALLFICEKYVNELGQWDPNEVMLLMEQEMRRQLNDDPPNRPT
jgi:hypothetical protein